MSRALVSGKLVTPKGIAKFPQLVTPSEKFQTLGVTLLLKADTPECNAFVSMIEGIQEECYKAEVDLLKAQRNKNASSTTRKKSVISNDEDKDGNPTGYVAFKFSIKGYDKDGKVVAIPKLDAKRNNLPNDLNIWGGSTLKLALFYKSVYAETQKVAGAKFFINAVQVIELVNSSGGGFGFAEEDGFTLEATLESTEGDVENVNEEESEPSF